MLVQLASERTGFHPVSRTVFRPPPNVDSALVAFRRVPLPDEFARIKQVVEASFAHRRKTLPNSIALAGLASRDAAAAALASIGRPPETRAEALAPREFVALTEAAVRAPAPAKINLALVVGPTRADGKHEVATVLQRIDLADRVAVVPGTALTVTGFAGDTIVRHALLALAEAAGVEPRWAATITKRIPVAAGLGGGSSDAATALRLANEALESPLDAADLRSLAATLGADVPFFLGDGPQLGRGDGSTLEPLDLPQDYWIVLVLPNGAAKASTAAVYADFDARDGGAGWEERRARLDTALGGVRRPRDLAALPPNDLASSPLASELLRHGAFRADVSGAGPTVYGLFHHRRQAEAARRALRDAGTTWLTVPVWYG